MAIASFLLKSASPPFSPLPLQQQPRRPTNFNLPPKPFSYPTTPNTYGTLAFALRTNYTSSIKCLATTTRDQILRCPFDFHPHVLKNHDSNESPFNVMAETLKKAAATLAIVFAVMISTAPFALALTGGRMGGRSSSSSSSSRSSSRSYSSGSSSSSYGRSYTFLSSSNTSSSCDHCTCVLNKETREEGNVMAVIDEQKEKEDWDGLVVALAVVIGMAGIGMAGIGLLILSDTVPDGITVLKLQVGTWGTREALQNDLNRIAAAADTSSSNGWAYILGETAESLRQRLGYCISVHSYLKKSNLYHIAMYYFDNISTKERLKFDEETLVNTNDREEGLGGWLKSMIINGKRKSPPPQNIDGPISNYAVVTIVIAAHGAYQLPIIKSSKDLEEALKILQSIPAKKIEALEVLWAPQQQNDTLSEQELHEKYPSLTPI